MDTAFVGPMPKQVKAAHENFFEARFQFGPFPLENTILGVWLDKTEAVRKKLADIVHTYGGYLFVDAAQSIGGIKVNVKDEDVDFMSGIPYKWLLGPNGLGFTYVREDLIPLITPDR